MTDPSSDGTALPAGDPAARDPRPGRLLFAITVALVTAGLLYLGLAPQHWLRGVLLVGSAFVFAGVVRLGFPDRKAGPLLVRGRLFDGAAFVLVGLAVVGFGIVVR